MASRIFNKTLRFTSYEFRILGGIEGLVYGNRYRAYS